MGIGPRYSSASTAGRNWGNGNVNPDPAKYTIVRGIPCGDHLVLEIKYDGCTNFEGKKILVMKNTSWIEVANMKTIDPHFTSASKVVARFRPDQDGWVQAVSFANGLKASK